MGRNSAVILLVFLTISGSLRAQENIYLVSLTDKNNSPFSINNPEEFLSERSIERKSRFSVAIKNEDLPVNPQYINTLSSNYDISILHSSRWFNAILVKTEASESVKLLGETFVKSVELIAIGTTLPGSETGYGSNYPGLTNALQNRMLGVPDMHQKGFKGEGMLIAIFDSGFGHVNSSSYFEHVYDNDRMIFTRDFIGKTNNVYQYDTHGSKAFSTFAAFKENEYDGVAHNADFVLCVTENIASEYRVEEYYWLLAAELADSLGADIISSSLAYTEFTHPEMNYYYEDLDGKTAIITQAAQLAARKGIIVVSSAGNDGNKSWKYINPPADADSILSVGSVNPDLQKSSFSSYGPTSDTRIKPDVCALGKDVIAVTGENLSKPDGTSFSAPQVSGLVAGFWQAFPEMTNQEVIEILKLAASNSSSPDTLIGYGVPNFTDAFILASNVEENTDETFVVYPNPVDGSKIFVASSGFLETGKVSVKFIDFKGSFIKSLTMQVYSSNEVLEIDISDLRQGYYIAEFNAENKSKVVKLVVL